MGGFRINNIEKYEALLKTSSSTLNGGEYLQDLHEHYGIKGDPSKYLRQEICSLLKSNVPTDLSRIDLTNLRDHSILEYFFYGTNNDICATLGMIWDVAREFNIEFVFPLDDKKKWNQAINYALDYNVLYDFFKKDLENTHSRIYNKAKSAQYFTRKGYNVEIEDSKIILDEKDKLKIIENIESKIKSLDGIGVINSLFSNVKNLFNKDLHRFHINRILGYNNKSVIPINYLLNLSLKYTGYETTKTDTNGIYGDILSDAQNLMVFNDVQPYSVFQTIFISFDAFIEYIQEIALFDSIFMPNQLRPFDVPRILKALFECVPSELRSNFDMELILDVIERIIELSKNNYTASIFFDSKALNLEEKYDLDSIEKTLVMLSHPEGSVNNDFYLPEQYENVDFGFKPLIKRNEIYILLNLSWCSPAFYEALAMYLRDLYGNWSKLQTDLGYGLETFVKNELKIKGISYSSGNYDMPLSGECDVVIESEDTIVFLELKTKPLTRKSRSGENIPLVIDITKSLLASQTQLGRHENTIREYGFIELENNQRIEFENRRILRISLSLLDFGGFHDWATTKRILEIMSGIELSVSDNAYQSYLDEINRKIGKFQEECQKLATIDSSFQQRGFHNCLFISLPLFLILLDNSDNADSFIEELSKLLYVSRGSLDPYYDYSISKGIFP